RCPCRRPGGGGGGGPRPRAPPPAAPTALKSWRLLSKLRCSTTRITSLVQAVLTLRLTCSG
ncbi:hypothetical protein ACFXI4_40380, partial [Streptomyces sp. NPDC059224]